MNHVIGVAAVLYDELGNVLLQHRRKEPGYGLHVLPGGRLDEPSPHKGIVRELKEELGIEINTSSVIPIWVADDILIDGSPMVMIYFSVWINNENKAKLQNMEPEKCYGIHWRPALEALHAKDMWLNDRLAISCSVGLLHIDQSRKLETV